jgi:hypothetical protein
MQIIEKLQNNYLNFHEPIFISIFLRGVHLNYAGGGAGQR